MYVDPSGCFAIFGTILFAAITTLMTVAILAIDDGSDYKGPSVDVNPPSISNDGIGASIEGSLGRKDWYLNESKTNSIYFSGFTVEAGIGYFKDDDGEIKHFNLGLSIFEFGLKLKYINLSYSLGIKSDFSIELDFDNIYKDISSFFSKLF